MIFTQFIASLQVGETKEGIILKNEAGVKFEARADYAATMDNSDEFDKTEKVTLTEMQNIVLGTSFTACTIVFKVKDVDKLKKDIKAEKEDLRLKASRMTIDGAIDFLLENPVLDYIPGDTRTMKGYHKGEMNSTGRLEFYDMEADGMKKAVDLRTVSQLIVKKTKYILK